MTDHAHGWKATGPRLVEALPRATTNIDHDVRRGATCTYETRSRDRLAHRESATRRYARVSSRLLLRVSGSTAWVAAGNVLLPPPHRGGQCAGYRERRRDRGDLRGLRGGPGRSPGRILASCDGDPRGRPGQRRMQHRPRALAPWYPRAHPSTRSAP